VQAWSPTAHLGPRLRVQAAAGCRAAVIELRPGLYLVAEVAEDVLREDPAASGRLEPLMTRSARHALEAPPIRDLVPARPALGRWVHPDDLAGDSLGCARACARRR
jgi:hypothetical protein